MVEQHHHFGALNGEGPGGANGRAGAALDANGIIPFDFLGGVLYINPLGFEVLDALFEIFVLAGELQDHVALFAGQDARTEDVENQVVVAGQIADQRLLDFVFGKTQDENFGIHGNLRMRIIAAILRPWSRGGGIGGAVFGR